MSLIEIRNLRKEYSPDVVPLKGVNADIEAGEVISIIGPSGTGKSTLLRCINRLETPTSGQIIVDGVDVCAPGTDLARLRKSMGMVFQSFNLIPRTSALSNVELPMLYARVGQKARQSRAYALLQTVKMGAWASHMPNELSGGQCQRVAIARAMANDPPIILADEPTGALDSHTGRMVMDIFHHLHENQHKTIVLITHNDELAEEAERIITIEDGRITGERAGKAARRIPDAAKVMEAAR